MTEDVLTITEAAELLKVTARTMYKYAESGTVPGRKVGGQWRFSRQALVSHLASEVAEETASEEK